MKMLAAFLAGCLLIALPLSAFGPSTESPLDQLVHGSRNHKKGKRPKRSKKVKPAHWGKPKHH